MSESSVYSYSRLLGKRPRMSDGKMVMESAGVDASTGYSAGGRVVDLDRPFRPANRQWSQASWKVPKWQYNKLKAHILKQKKPAVRRYQRRPYQRRYSGGSTTDGHLGPIVITGRGGYYTDKLQSGASAAYRALQRGVPKGTWNRLGAAAGGAMFGAPGAAAGRWLGQGVSNVLGFGDYSIVKNDLMMLDEGVPVPTFQDLNQGIVICHREYIGDIVQSATFVNRSYRIQPGDGSTFPWLSQIASQFEQYELLGCLFQFRSTASDFGTTTNMAMGTVIMATEYDSVDAAYLSKLEMENAQYSMSGKPSHDIIHPVECDPSVVGPSGLKYIRTGPVPSGKDDRLYDHGNFQLATTGMPASSGVIGELWVTYKIAFYKPQFNLGNHIRTDFFSSASYNNTHYWGLNPTVDPPNSIGCTISGNILTFPTSCVPGQKFLITWNCQCAATAIGTGFIYAFSNCAVGVLESIGGGGASTTDNFFVIMSVVINGTPTAASPSTITLTNATVVGGQINVKVIITQVDTESSVA